MAEPGDLPPTDDPLDDHGDHHDDDLIGFAALTHDLGKALTPIHTDVAEIAELSD